MLALGVLLAFILYFFQHKNLTEEEWRSLSLEYMGNISHVLGPHTSSTESTY